MNKTDNVKRLQAPTDESITSIFLTGIESDIAEQDIKNYFYSYGEIKSVVVLHKSKCAFVNYATRAAAQLAIDRTFNNCNIKSHVLRVQWGRPKTQGMYLSEHDFQALGGCS